MQELLLVRQNLPQQIFDDLHTLFQTPDALAAIGRPNVVTTSIAGPCWSFASALPAEIARSSVGGEIIVDVRRFRPRVAAALGRPRALLTATERVVIRATVVERTGLHRLLPGQPSLLAPQPPLLPTLLGRYFG